MVLQRMTWPQVDAADRSLVVVIPAGSIEQHGPGLPVVTDTLIATAVAEEVERRLPDKVLLTPTVWLGCSEHHIDFAGTLTAEFAAYMGVFRSIVESLSRHGFTRFYALNGHGGNIAPISLAFRELTLKYPNHVFGNMGYFELTEPAIEGLMEGPQKHMVHACEAETSLMMHLGSELVHRNELAADGMRAEPEVQFLVQRFSNETANGVFGHPQYATAAKGRAIFEAAVGGCVKELAAVYDGFVFRGDPKPTGSGG